MTLKIHIWILYANQQIENQITSQLGWKFRDEKIYSRMPFPNYRPRLDGNVFCIQQILSPTVNIFPSIHQWFTYETSPPENCLDLLANVQNPYFDVRPRKLCLMTLVIHPDTMKVFYCFVSELSDELTSCAVDQNSQNYSKNSFFLLRQHDWFDFSLLLLFNKEIY